MCIPYTLNDQQMIAQSLSIKTPSMWHCKGGLAVLLLHWGSAASANCNEPCSFKGVALCNASTAAPQRGLPVSSKPLQFVTRHHSPCGNSSLTCKKWSQVAKWSNQSQNGQEQVVKNKLRNGQEQVAKWCKQVAKRGSKGLNGWKLLLQTSGGEEPKVPGTEPISQERPVSVAVFFTVCTLRAITT